MPRDKKVEEVELPEGSGAPDELEKTGLKAPSAPTIAELQKQLEESNAAIAELNRIVQATADKGRLANYESGKGGKKPMRVNLSVYGGGYIVGWQTLRDELIKNPTTGRTVGEEQLYEVLVLKPDGGLVKQTINSYPAFSDARYTNRVEVEVVGKRENYEGNISFDIALPDGRQYTLDARFVN